MELKQGLHLAYCTNIHRGERWLEILSALERHTLPVRDRVAAGRPYAIGLRLGASAVCDLQDRSARSSFRHWLDRHDCYVFTVNGFPFGAFHGTRVKEQVYRPDWTEPERLDYTCRLFDLLAEWVPEGVEGSVSTVPGSFKEFIRSEAQVQAMVDNLWRCVDHVAAVSGRCGRELHLDLEPEPLCFLETSEETVRFFERLRAARPGDDRLQRHVRVNYDACHLAVEFEEPAAALRDLHRAGVRVGKIHLSSALKVLATPTARAALAAFADPVYFHQVVARSVAGGLERRRDLPEALSDPSLAGADGGAAEWRIHYHIPLHHPPGEVFGTTQDHVLGLLDVLQGDPTLCTHFEMETYTWEVLPPELKNADVVDQLAAEYAWTLGELRRRGLA